jgi:cohesin complex subunit SA-1/2
MWSAHESEILYDDVFCETLQTWLVALSSSHVRAFRHTATVVALFVSSAICDIRATLGEEFGKASRQRDAEKKKGRADKARLKDMEQKVTELHKKQERLNEYLEEIFSA